MAGLLDGFLPYIYSRSDALKRQLGGLLADPAGTLAQALGNANDRAGGLLAMTSAAAQERNFGPASQQLAGLLADSYNPVGMIDVKALAAKYPDVAFSLSQRGDGGTATLGKVVVPPESRGQGIGSSFMSDLTRAADADGATLALSPSADFGGRKSRLIEFYKRFGFVPNKGRNIDYEISESMYRPPSN